MNNKKVLGLLLSLALIIGVVVPGTLAASVDSDSTDSSFSAEASLPAPESSVPAGTEKTCTCVRNEDGTLTDTEGCPVHGAPEVPVTEPECTCVRNEDGTLTFTAGCPVHDVPVPAEPEKPAHIEGCSDECIAEDCACPCHEKTLFERLMACETLEALFAIVDETPEEALLALTEEENAQIEAKIAALEPEPLPPVVIDGEAGDEPVVSEIIYPTVNFANVAPFGAPVAG